MDREDDAPVELPIEDSIDLHTFRPRDVLDVVDAYLEAAQDAGFVEVRIIHGKGTGYQRSRVQELLGRHPRVESYRDAPGHRGHWGATLVVLRAAGQDGARPRWSQRPDPAPRPSSEPTPSPKDAADDDPDPR